MKEQAKDWCWFTLGVFGAFVWAALLASTIDRNAIPSALGWCKAEHGADGTHETNWAYTDEGESVSPLKTLALTTARSGKWEGVRNTYAKAHPKCVFCGGPVENVHHKIPFWIWPEGELVESNLCSVCRFDHKEWCHLGDWKSWNTELDRDIARWRMRIETRPMKGKVME